MGDVIPEEVLERKRAERRLAQFNDTIDHFTEYSHDALTSANNAETAKHRYIDSLPEWLQRDLGYR